MTELIRFLRTCFIDDVEELYHAGESQEEELDCWRGPGQRRRSRRMMVQFLGVCRRADVRGHREPLQLRRELRIPLPGCDRANLAYGISPHRQATGLLLRRSPNPVLAITHEERHYISSPFDNSAARWLTVYAFPDGLVSGLGLSF